MATIPASVKAQLDADWTGAGGAEPPYYVAEDYRTNPPLGGDSIWILDNTDTDPRVVNDTFVNEFLTIDIVVTATTADRLKEIGDEVVRILNATAITGVTYQRYNHRRNVSGTDVDNVFINQEIITYDMREYMKTSSTAYGSTPGTAAWQVIEYTNSHWLPVGAFGHDGTNGSLGAFVTGQEVLGRYLVQTGGACRYFGGSVVVPDVKATSITMRLWYMRVGANDPVNVTLFGSFFNVGEGGSYNVWNGVGSAETFTGDQKARYLEFTVTDADLEGYGVFSITIQILNMADSVTQCMGLEFLFTEDHDN